jgi:hypothetical protein
VSRDPERLLSGASDADELERSLLSSVRDADPPGEAHARVWRGLATQIAAATLASAAQASTLGASASASAGAATSAFVSKTLAAKLVFGLALGGAAAGAGFAWTSARAVSTPPMAAGAAALSSAARSGRVLEQRASEPAPASVPETPAESPASGARGSVRGEPREQADDERLRAESQLLARARAELRQGNSAAARATLQRLQARFPKGVLHQEREVLAIEILSAQGKTAASERRARAFIKAYPGSPHSTNLRRLTESP